MHLPVHTSDVLPPPESRLIPQDRKIVGGIALVGEIDAHSLLLLQERLTQEFNVLRSDESSEYGSCIAYGWGVELGVQERIDNALVDAASQQNHGMLTQAIYEGHTLWVGADGSKGFNLLKYTGPLVTVDGQAPDGIVYSLIGGYSA